MLNPYSFMTGRLTCTTGIMEAMQGSIAVAHFVSQSVQKYLNADWGDTHPDDCLLNAEAIRNMRRIFAVYTSRELDMTIWIITEADRQFTTILFPSEY